ncbi:MAG: DUF4392 domain-containing protein [Acutalibacteraceae bacterium]
MITISHLTVEDIILRHSSRGMDILRPYIASDFCRNAAHAILNSDRGNVLLATGFYVAGFAETDGPPGALFLSKALNLLGFECTIVTDKFCRGFFESDGVNVEYIDIKAAEKHYAELLDKYAPKWLISIERCGVNAEGDYANMRGESIAEYTARIDLMFDEGRRRGIPTVGIGDGGNEIGMGNFRGIIEQKLSLKPCVIEADYPIIATVSNWGAYGLCAYLQRLSGERLMPDYSEIEAYLQKISVMGSIDGVTKRHVPTVDGFAPEIEREIIDSLNAAAVV